MKHWNFLTSNVLIYMSGVRPIHTYMHGTLSGPSLCLKYLGCVRSLADISVIIELDLFFVIWCTHSWFRMAFHWLALLIALTIPWNCHETSEVNWHKKLCTSEHYSSVSCLGLIMYPLITDSGCFWCSIIDPVLHITGFHAARSLKQKTARQ